MTVPALAPIKNSIESGDCLLLVLSKPRQGMALEYSKVSIRPVVVKQQESYQFTFHFPRKETHENLDPATALARVEDLLDQSFEHASLYTPAADYNLRAQRNGSFSVKTRPPSKSTAVPKTHNRAKAYLIPEGTPCPFLIEMGVMTSTGQVRAAMHHKFRQINRFLELVNDIIPELPQAGTLRVVDFGCGKSYLTFALHHLLTHIHRRDVLITGLDRNADVIRTCTAVAERLECTGLDFHVGDISTHFADAPLSEGSVDLAVSLHACDTATDDALANAVASGCRVILAVPCCQHELSRMIENDDLAPLTQHGILHERFAALATDALRAQALEICGYATQVVEFIDLEHTAKNLLIRAVRKPLLENQRTTAMARYARFRQILGIGETALERALTAAGVPFNPLPPGAHEPAPS